MPEQKQEYKVGDDGKKIRLDVFLERNTSLTRSQVQKHILDGKATIDGQVARAGKKLTPGEVICFSPEIGTEPDALIPEDGEIDILYEDEFMLAINKPSGLLSHPNPGHCHGSILNVLLNKGYCLQGGDDPLRQGLAHRLDKDTSGVLLLGKTQEAWLNMQNSFRDRKVHKIYHAVAYGELKRMEFSCAKSIGRNPKKRHARVVCSDGREALTRFRRLKELDKNLHLIEASPHTGRTHQIRVHLHHLGFTVLGDPLYRSHPNLKKSFPTTTRTLLHSKSLKIAHPITGKELAFEAPYPADFSEICETQEN